MDTQSLGRYLRCLLSQEAMLYVMEADDYSVDNCPLFLLARWVE